MLSAPKMVEEVKDQEKSVVKPTLEQNEKLEEIRSKLQEKVQSIQQDFDAAWNKYPTESRITQVCYLISNEGASRSNDTQIQSLLARFQKYKSIEQIQKDFTQLRAYWEYQCGANGVLESFGKSYLISLRMMEVLFICAYKDNLAYVIQSTSISEYVLSVDTESKVNIESIVKQVKSSYEVGLADQLFASSSKTLMDEILPEVVDLNRNIDLYHDRITTVFEVKAVSADDKAAGDLITSKILQLLSEELAYAELLISDDIDILKQKQQELLQSRAALLAKHNQQIDAFLTTIRPKVVSVDVDYDAISELSPLMKELRQAEASILLIEEKNKLRLLESDAAVCLKEAIIANKAFGGSSLKDQVSDFSRKYGLIRNRQAISAMLIMYNRVLGDLDKSPHIIKLDNLTSPEVIDVTKWTDKRDSILQKLETIKSQVIETVTTHTSSLGFQKLRQEIINRKGDELRTQASSYKEITPLPIHLLDSRRAELDKKWKVLLESPESIEKLKRIPKNLLKMSEPLSPSVKKEVYIQTATLFNKKLEPFLVPAKKAEQQAQSDKPVLSGLELVDAGQELKQQSQSPISLFGSVQFEVGMRHDQKPKRHWYSGFIDKPWKRALLVGLSVFALAALAATGVGLILEIELSIMLAIALGGGAGLGLFSGGITYSCTSDGHEPPTKITQVKPENVTLQNDLIDRRRAAIMRTVSAPSVFAVHASNSLNDHESPGCFDWFLRRRKDNIIEQPAQDPSSNLKIKKGK